jgi:hypothetical protein
MVAKDRVMELEDIGTASLPERYIHTAERRRYLQREAALIVNGSAEPKVNAASPKWHYVL